MGGSVLDLFEVRGQARARPAPPRPARNPVAGIDFEAKYEDIRRLTCAHPYFRVCIARGFDAEDVLQTVFLGLLARQAGRGGFNPARSSFGHYVHMCAGSILSNVLRSRISDRMEQVGTADLLDGTPVDARQVAEASVPAPEVEPDEERLVEALLAEVPASDVEVARALLAGVGKGQAIRRWGRERVVGVLADLRAGLEARR